MRLTILAVGRLKAGPERDLFDRYSDRIAKAGRSLHFQGPNLCEVPEARDQNIALRKDEEAKGLLSAAGDTPRIILLDEFGKDIDSRGFADLIKDEQDYGTTNLSFAIGGPDGHGDTLKRAAIRKIRFGAMTWPHQIARVLLVEQIYRSITILSGHPYHRD